MGPESFALQTDGTVMSLNRSSSTVVSDVLFSKLEPGSTTWTPEALLEASVDTASQDLFAFGEGFLGTFIRDTGVAAASTYLPVTGWELSRGVGLSGADNNGCGAVGTSQAVLLTALSAGTTFAGIYDGQSWSFDDLGANLCFGQVSWSSGQGSVVGVGAGNDVQVALHASSTWSGSEVLGRVPANGFFIPGAAIDAAGQALAAWPTNDGSVADTELVGVAVRRYVPGLGWEGELPLDVLAFETSVYADPLGGMTIVGYHSTPGLWWVRFE